MRESTSSGDRVTELYQKQILATEVEEQCKDRIHWICAHAEGNKVLDLGCSQGATSLLLAEEGFDVVGVDGDKAAIESAISEKTSLSQQTAERVKFVLSDIFELDQPAGHFDTLVLGEVLAHLSQPDRLLRKSCNFLKKGGRVIITTPLGYNQSDDHRQHFTLSDFLMTVAPFFEPESIDITDGFIRFIGTYDGKEDPNRGIQYDSIKLLALTEKGLLQSQENLYSIIADYNKKIAALSNALESEGESNTKLKSAVETFSEETRRIENKVLDKSTRLNITNIKNAQLREQIIARADDIKKGMEENFRLKGELTSLERRLVADHKYIRTLERIPHSYRYRLGSLLLESFASPRNLILFPFRITALLYEGLKMALRKIVRKISPSRASYTLGETEILLSTSLDSRGLELTENWARELVEKKYARQEYVCRVMFDLVRQLDLARAFPYGDKAVKLNPGNLTLLKVLSELYLKEGNLGRADRLLKMLRQHPGYVAEVHEPRGATPDAEINKKYFLSRRSAPKAATILDTFSASCFEYELDTTPISKKDWRKEITSLKPDLVFAESAWQGNEGEWRLLFSKFKNFDPNPLKELTNWCSQENVPSIFWNKEDPVNYDVFIDSARNFDHIFTTDQDIVERYKKELGHDRVYPLPFAAQPAIHNPTGSSENKFPKGCFAGAWRGEKYPGRAREMEILLDPAMEQDCLEIYDRYADHPDAEKLGFPEKYREAVVGSLPYSEMLDRYKRYLFFLNVNSVPDSPTMFSRRVFEILACGTPVISTPSLGIEKLLGEHVLITHSKEETRQMVQKLLNDPDYRDRLGHRGYRYVMQNHTYAKRVEEMLSKIVISINIRGSVQRDYHHSVKPSEPGERVLR